MTPREPIVTAGMVTVLLVSWLGFLWHRSPRFAGSGTGGLLAVSGALLMLVPLLYAIVKRVPPLKRRVTAWVGMPTLLRIHVYAGLLGPLLVVLHTGHRFGSPIGVALTTMTLVVAISGYVGRYLLTAVSKQAAAQKRLLSGLEAEYRYVAAELTARPEQQLLVRRYGGFLGRLAARAAGDTAIAPAARVVDVATSMADVESAIRSQELVKRLFTRWLHLHIVLSFVLYSLLALHVYSAVHFGIRWFQ